MHTAPEAVCGLLLKLQKRPRPAGLGPQMDRSLIDLLTISLGSGVQTGSHRPTRRWAAGCLVGEYSREITADRLIGHRWPMLYEQGR